MTLLRSFKHVGSKVTGTISLCRIQMSLDPSSHLLTGCWNDLQTGLTQQVHDVIWVWLVELMDGNSEYPSLSHWYICKLECCCWWRYQGRRRSCTPARVFACRVTPWNLLYGFFLVLTYKPFFDKDYVVVQQHPIRMHWWEKGPCHSRTQHHDPSATQNDTLKRWVTGSRYTKVYYLLKLLLCMNSTCRS